MKVLALAKCQLQIIFLINDFKNEYFFEMKISCKNCYLFQLVEQPDKNLMFHDDYMFFSSLSKNMKLHFHNFFNEIEKIFEKF